ncbi:MAG: right-handed parallel beta-helix repeat-containing protein [Sphingomonas sp.]|uniref:right-handed parallel beta-helix repeat-containing protein n=1 Tax=Sphingomonas sp. TaxID=28214 RepID=UPI001B006126|nr:right-handed parallel beta-helix repeat-containing protein [Sphingomonas sp.]MBO9622457.1 right-handed parallel beta-helix repeat-containing protein [Sphingomonas sp.]
MHIQRRTLIVGAVAASLGAAASVRTCRASVGAARLSTFRGAGDKDDNAALRRALATGRPVHLAAGEGAGPSGEYLLGSIELGPGAVITGDGIGRTIVRPAATEALRPNIFFCDSGSGATTVRGIQISDLTLRGWSVERGFAEHEHLLNFNGVEDLSIARVAFEAFRGDALYLGSGTLPGQERHNRAIRVTNCTFDGVNHQNRNGISIIDADDIAIENCSFRNCTRPDMPGAIDMEPDQTPLARVRNIRVRNCRFARVGGNFATIALSTSAAVRTLPSQILIENNIFEDYAGVGAEISLDVGRRLSSGDPDMGVIVRGNRGRGGRSIYAFYAAKGVRAEGNEWRDYAAGSIMGFDKPHQLLRNARIADRFMRCGLSSKVGLGVFNVSGLALDGSEFVDCGDGGPNAYAIDFDRGASESVSLRGVRVLSPTGRTRHAVMREAAHRFSPRSNVENGNDFGGLSAISISR